MAALNVAVALASGTYPLVNFGSGSLLELGLTLSVSDANGAPVTGLMQSQVGIVLAGPASQYPSQLVLTGSQPQLDDNGDPVLDENGNPVMIPVPGPAEPAGLPGFYRMTLFVTHTEIGGRVVVEAAVNTGGDMGQALGTFEIVFPH